MSDIIVDFPKLWKQLSLRYSSDRITIHGPDHWKRVEENGLQLAQETPDADVIVIKLFAVFHDSQRMNDWADPDHGPRAAKLVKKKQGSWFEITDSQLDLLVEACRFHTEGTTHNDPTIGCCWDADRLDLDRVNIIPHPEFMSTECGKRLAVEWFQ